MLQESAILYPMNQNGCYRASNIIVAGLLYCSTHEATAEPFVWYGATYLPILEAPQALRPMRFLKSTCLFMILIKIHIAIEVWFYRGANPPVRP